MESGWDIVRLLGEPNGEYGIPRESACRVEKFYLGPSFQLTRPVTVTAAIISHPDHEFRNGKPHYHQMTMDRIEKNEYVLQNNQLSYDLPVIRIPMRNAYFDEKSFKNGRVQYDLFKWYIFPQAYTITLIPKNSQSVTEINCASTSDRMKQLAISP
ncbi:Oidioi.mRNA.OKI2018_I69.PAR.g8942.t1.cds [Oikopleura dioica]|uniref:Oidioi.mRNA.OKI2018_I69.PAR.g8942.t1.cds n=1 Tax=Oikopleura dioica TaxID=34765 RepID=A0ABN7RI95_OIKDI|nr:Oidioi.mRNA.OKI2018_I69.PAR.g8942.t1.cds [Oikopleura dioica]